MIEQDATTRYLIDNGMSQSEIDRLRQQGITMEEIHHAARDILARGESLAPQEESATNTIFQFYTLPALTDAERQPPEFIVKGMIPVGLSFLSGAPKTRKSFLALQLAASVANGRPFLGFQTKKCSVVYLDLEGSKSRISYRADRMSLTIPDSVLIANSIPHRIADGLVNDVRDLVRQRSDIQLVVIDTYSRARGQFRSGGANAYDADVSLLEPLQRMAISERIAVLCVHHDRKGAGFATDSFERLSGTMGISGSADAVLNLITSGKRFDGKATLEYTPRDAKGGELRMVFDENCGEWRSDGELNQDPLMNPVCRFLIENIPGKQKEGVFMPYEDIYQCAFHRYSENPGAAVRAALAEAAEPLFIAHRIGIQQGVQSHGRRGIRVINLR